eukprot:11239046-Karenia_brevis.AAC.1
MEYTSHKLVHDGLEVFGPLYGTSTSSSRPELLAAIFALLAPQPLHIGIDNLGVVRTANKLLDRMLSPHPRQSPAFCIMADGDLWNIFWGVAMKRGPRSIKISKVKGHADIKH